LHYALCNCVKSILSGDSKIIQLKLLIIMLLLTPKHWKDYELIDSGGYEKLERFGNYVLSRPEPQAVWNKALSDAEWNKTWNAQFTRHKSNPDKGEWKLKPNMPEQWTINYQYEEMNLVMRLGLTAFKHVGIFPEQAENWNFIYDCAKTKKAMKVLNLFAYTGGASLAACAAHAKVVHVDSVKQVVSWSRQNMEASNLNNISWIVEDAMKYVAREVRRGSVYDGIILDPPAYGRGPDGEKWELENGINELISLCSKLLSPTGSFFILNLYSMGFSAMVADNLVSGYFKHISRKEYGELYFDDHAGRRLPLGVFFRFISQ